MDTPRLAVVCDNDEDRERLQALAGELGLPLIESLAPTPPDLLLSLQQGRLALVQSGPGAPGPVSVDFGGGRMRQRRRGGQNELLGKAIGVGRKSPLRVLDATAGLGRDSFVLADLGCEVTLCERHAVVAALLASGLEQARCSDDEWLRATARRMQLAAGDARQLPGPSLAAVDVIYLDPMFPHRGKSAAVKKEMALFQRLIGIPEDEGDSEVLLRWALQQPVARVVVKRPLKAPPLDAHKPSHAIRGKAVRFDVHVLATLGAKG
ncbi:class I SAM-dependent methyltransferase [Parahaliea aestuarii]|uniref:Ribosomal RNA small subunit methyltransferase J n=1 Tax=Parahaliea aestuarii TaxID=1852021 RepID=A0A5C8ZPY9_9GAMM|nr:class I SAM-dependent methyltransferase [Parahaliea aestuarii]TXS89710.1 rRNA methyltransferase [Parahaliea aestuarii]